MIKAKGSPLRLKKVGVNSVMSEILKTKQSEISGLHERDQVRKKIEQRMNVNVNANGKMNSYKGKK